MEASVHTHVASQVGDLFAGLFVEGRVAAVAAFRRIVSVETIDAAIVCVAASVRLIDAVVVGRASRVRRGTGCVCAIRGRPKD